MKPLLVVLLLASLVANIVFLSGCCTIYGERQPNVPEVKVIRDDQATLTRNWTKEQKESLEAILSWVEKAQGHIVVHLDDTYENRTDKWLFIRFTDSAKEVEVVQ